MGTRNKVIKSMDTTNFEIQLDFEPPHFDSITSLHL